MLIEILKAIVIGIVEGITEWLPISSSTHIEIAQNLLKTEYSEAFFGGLDSYADAGYYHSHRDGLLVLPGKVYDLKVFAVLEADAYDEVLYKAGNVDPGTLTAYLKDMSPLCFDEETAEEAEKIIAMSTCQSARTNGRFVVIADAEERTLTKQQLADEVIPEEMDGTAAAGTGAGGAGPDGGEQSTAVVGTEDTPLANFINSFIPRGGVHGDGAWALLNLICVVITVYLLVPLFSLKAKFGRRKMMKQVNGMEGHEDYYEVGRFGRRSLIGISLEAVAAAGSVIFFLLTENLSLPMTLIDKWTPLMLLILLAAWFADIRLVRYREGTPEDLEDGNKEANVITE